MTRRRDARIWLDTICIIAGLALVTWAAAPGFWWVAVLGAWLVLICGYGTGWVSHEQEVERRVLSAGMEMIQNEVPMTAAQVIELRSRTTGPDHE